MSSATSDEQSQFAHKIQIPRGSGNTIHRQRLTDLLHQNLNAGIQIICAPAGYGKTTLLIDFCNDLEIPICWYAIDSTDLDLEWFVKGITESIRLKFPEFGNAIQSLLTATEKSSVTVTRLAGALTADMLQNTPDYFLLVIEDYHLIEGTDSAKVLDIIFRQMPEHCHLLISSRTAIDTPTIHIGTIRDRIFTVTATDMAFSSTEVKELLTLRKGPDLSDKEIEMLVRENDGWVVGLLLQIERLRSGSTVGSLPSLSIEDLFSYLATEVYTRLPEDIQSFLLKSSTLGEIEPEFCNQLLDIQESQKLLRHIQRRNLFLFFNQTDKPHYRYHHLFRHFLQEQLADDNPKEFRRLHAKAARMFEQEYRWQEALDHYMAARHYSKAKIIIKKTGQNLINTGKWTGVLKTIESLPSRFWLDDIDLLLLRAQCNIHTGKIDEANHLLTRVVSASANSQSWFALASALNWRSASFRLAGNLDAALSDITAAISLLERNAGPVDNLGDAYRRLGTVHIERGNLKTALKYLKRALKKYASIFATEQSASIHNSLGVVYQSLGNLTEASMHLNLARQGWQRVENNGALASVLNNLGLVYQSQGDFDHALKTFHEGLQHARESGYRRMETCILISTADLMRDVRFYDEALSLYGEGLKRAEEVMETYYTICAIAGIGETQRLLGTIDKAELSLRQAISLAEEYHRSTEAVRISIRLGIIEYQRGEYEKALSIFKPAAALFRKNGDKEALARTCFHMAQAFFLSRRYSESKECLMEASYLADKLGYDTFFAIEGRNTTLLLQYAVTEKVGGKRFINVLEAIRTGKGSIQLSEPAEFHVCAVDNSKPTIEVCAFGEARVTVNGHRILDSEWRSGRALEMFFYLLSVKTTKTREQITAALWPDLSPAKSTSNFHISLYRVRQAIYPGIVVLKEGRYRITADPVIWYDMVEFTRIVGQIKDTSTDSKSKIEILQKAVDLYSGPFLLDIYSDWAESLRHELESKYLLILQILARWYYEIGDYPKTMNLLEKIIEIDPSDNEIYQEINKWIPTKRAGLLVEELKRYLNRRVNNQIANNVPSGLPGHQSQSRR